MVFSTFLDPCIYGSFARTENEVRNRAPSDQRKKGSKTRQNDEVRGRFLADFSDFLAKMADFTAQRAKSRLGPSKNCHF